MSLVKNNSRSAFEKKENELRVYEYIEDSPAELMDLEGTS
jgi:hypothetical protein